MSTHTEDTTDEMVEEVLRAAAGILLERLEGDFQIIWTGYDDDLQITRTAVKGHGNLHSRLSATEMWVARSKEQLLDEDAFLTFEPWDDETGEPE